MAVKKQGEEKQEQKLTGMRSLASLVVVGVIAAMLVIAIVAEVVNVVEFRANYKETVQNDLLTMVRIGGNLMDAKAVQIKASPGILEELIGDIKLEHADSSYAYAVDGSGIMLIIHA